MSRLKREPLTSLDMSALSAPLIMPPVALVRRRSGSLGRRGRTAARRDADNTELAALPAAVDWPNLKYL